MGEPSAARKGEPTNVIAVRVAPAEQAGATPPIVVATDLTTLARQINEAHAKCLGLFRNTLEQAIAVGQMLARAKEQVGHGRWRAWLDGNCSFGVRQAQRYMALVTKCLDLSDATRMSLLPAPKTGEPAGQIATGRSGGGNRERPDADSRRRTAMLGVLIETRFIEHRLDGRLRELEELVLKNSSKGGRKRVCCVLQRIETRVAEMRRSFERS